MLYSYQQQYYMKFLATVRKQLKENGIAEYRANQIFKDVFNNGIDSYDEMTTLPKYVKDFVKEHIPVYSITLNKKNISHDKATHKALFDLHDGHTIEAVFDAFLMMAEIRYVFPAKSAVR